MKKKVTEWWKYHGEFVKEFGIGYYKYYSLYSAMIFTAMIIGSLVTGKKWGLVPKK